VRGARRVDILIGKPHERKRSYKGPRVDQITVNDERLKRILRRGVRHLNTAMEQVRKNHHMSQYVSLSQFEKVNKYVFNMMLIELNIN
jgi:hypothetical protein